MWLTTEEMTSIYIKAYTILYELLFCSGQFSLYIVISKFSYALY